LCVTGVEYTSTADGQIKIKFTISKLILLFLDLFGMYVIKKEWALINRGIRYLVRSGHKDKVFLWTDN